MRRRRADRGFGSRARAFLRIVDGRANRNVAGRQCAGAIGKACALQYRREDWNAGGLGRANRSRGEGRHEEYCSGGDGALVYGGVSRDKNGNSGGRAENSLGPATTTVT